ncbi:MAG: DegT/DnrJ/EryC1/StrS family aminotransferase [Akkermansiaceae bacterium]
MKDKPAILGGEPTVTCSEEEFEKANAWPILGNDELDAINQLFHDGNISTHPIIGELEQGYCELAERKYGVAHCNGTTALMAAFWSLNLEPGDRVFVPSATFWASVLPMMWMGLVPVFCETEPDQLGLDIEDMRAKWTPDVKAMVIVPLWGMPSNYSTLMDFAAEKNLRIIEDASHAHGARYRGRPCGSFGDVSVFSLQGDKLAPAGEGGVLLTDDDEIHERVLCLGDITRIYQLDSPARRFAATSFGIKTRIAPVSAAIGLCQLNKLQKANAVRKENMVAVSSALEIYGFETYMDTEHTERTYFEFLVRCDESSLDAGGWMQALRAEGCSVDLPRYPLLHQQPFFSEETYKKVLRLPDDQVPDYSEVTLPKTQSLNEQMLKLPSFPNAAPDVLASYINAIHEVGENSDSIAAALGKAST